MTTRLKNTIKDVFVNFLNPQEIARVFMDCEVNVIPSEVRNKGNRETVFDICYSSIHPDPVIKENKLIEALNEAFRVIDRKIKRPTIYSRESLDLIYISLPNELRQGGYEYSNGGYSKTIVHTSQISNSDEIKRLKTELKADIGKLSSQDIIGKSKELLEATFKLICDKRNIDYTKDDKFPNLMGKAVGSLELLTVEVTEKDKSIKSLISIINGSSANINEIRNHHGSGHGKNGDYKPVDKETATFIANIALSISGYLESRISKA